jgi:undecaprenyl diphosphate synthase
VRICREAEARTAHNDRFFLNVAFNYGGKADIMQAAQRFAEEVAAGRAAPCDLTEERLESYLLTADSPPPDLIVRPSGERRLSNFLLWQAAYAEFVFQDVLWPDYTAAHLSAAIGEFQTRDRRYGGVMADDALAAG